MRVFTKACFLAEIQVSQTKTLKPLRDYIILKHNQMRSVDELKDAEKKQFLRKLFEFQQLTNFFHKTPLENLKFEKTLRNLKSFIFIFVIRTFVIGENNLSNYEKSNCEKIKFQSD